MVVALASVVVLGPLAYVAGVAGNNLYNLKHFYWYNFIF